MSEDDRRAELLQLLQSEPDHGVRERKLCAACQGESYRLLVELPYAARQMQGFRQHPGTLERWYLEPLMARFPFKLVECRSCGLVWQPYVLSEEVERLVYEMEARPYEPGIRTWKWPESWRKYRYYARLVERASSVFFLLNPKPPERIEVLDFGAGWGEFARAAQALGHSVTAAELNPLKRERLESLGIACVDLPLPPGHAFDFVHSDQVFEHLADPGSVLGMLSQHLAPGGYILLAVPALRRRGLEAALERGDLAAIHRHYPFLHVNMFGRRSLRALGGRLGLTPVDVRTPVSTRIDLLTPRARLGRRAKSLVRRAARRLFPAWERVFNGVQVFRAGKTSSRYG